MIVSISVSSALFFVFVAVFNNFWIVSLRSASLETAVPIFLRSSLLFSLFTRELSMVDPEDSDISFSISSVPFSNNCEIKPDCLMGSIFFSFFNSVMRSGMASRSISSVNECPSNLPSNNNSLID